MPIGVFPGKVWFDDVYHMIPSFRLVGICLGLVISKTEEKWTSCRIPNEKRRTEKLKYEKNNLHNQLSLTSTPLKMMNFTPQPSYFYHVCVVKTGGSVARTWSDRRPDTRQSQSSWGRRRWLHLVPRPRPLRVRSVWRSEKKGITINIIQDGAPQL